MIEDMDRQKFFEKKSGAEWADVGRERALSLFHEAAERVPAYRDFLKKNGVSHGAVRTWADFKEVPQTDKKNYLRQYPIADLCWDGRLEDKTAVFSMTSGSTGQPFYFPRSPALDWQYSFALEDFFSRSPIKKPHSTLVVITFGMGTWIAGTITYRAAEIASERMKEKFSIITPGIHKKQIFQILKDLSPQFSETVLIGYPPFVKDVLDEAEALGIPLKTLGIRLVFAAEVFSEQFRDYVAEKCGMANSHLHTMNIYGSADIGAMAVETPLAIVLRKRALADGNIFKKLFGDINKTPTFAQFHPRCIQFESVRGEILLSGDNVMPLIRYAIGDQGGVLSYDDIRPLLQNVSILDKTSELPFVYVYERSDFAVSLYGITIYPEMIRDSLYEVWAQEITTGKFTASTEYDEDSNQFMSVVLELRSGVQTADDSAAERVCAMIRETMRKYSSEFHELSEKITDRQFIRVRFLPHEDPLFFAPGRKHQWVRK